jgi:dihydroflavonol-4-reductase
VQPDWKVVNRIAFKAGAVMRVAKKWAITGATGLVGNNLVRLLKGKEVRVLVRKANPRELVGLDVEQVEGDLESEAALQKLCSGADIVVHSAAAVWIGRSRLEELQRVNVEGTRRICEAIKPGTRLLHVSSVDALGFGSREQPADENAVPRPEEGGAPYVDTKRAADRVVLQSGLNAVLVYPTLMLGGWDWKPSSGKMIQAIARGEARLAPAGANNFVHVRDVVEAMVAAAEGAPSGSRWILGNENLSYFEAWSRIARVIGAKAPLGTLPRWLGGPATWALDLPWRLGFKEGEVNGVATRFGFLDHCFDAGRARRELGLKQTPLEEAVRDAWEFFQGKG